MIHHTLNDIFKITFYVKVAKKNLTATKEIKCITCLLLVLQLVLSLNKKKENNVLLTILFLNNVIKILNS